MTKTFLPVLLCMAVAACSTTGGSNEQDSSSVEDRSSSSNSSTSSAQTGNSATTYGTGGDSSLGMSALEDPNSQLSERIIYFGYDSSDVQEQYRDVIEAHAQYLIQNPGTSMSLEGHADERGSREYNLALGERRSIAIKRQMTVLGVSSSQVRTVSYGEERPLDEGHDEFSWSQNRRVEIIY